MFKRTLFCLAILCTPAMAQDQPMAFAAAIAPEQSFDVCFKPDVIAAATCALDKCKKASGVGGDCFITSACGRGWSGSMGIMTDDVHWTETVCGAPNETAVVAALTAFCKGHAKYARECYLSTVWDDRGKEKPIEKSLDPKTLK